MYINTGVISGVQTLYNREDHEWLDWPNDFVTQLLISNRVKSLTKISIIGAGVKYRILHCGELSSSLISNVNNPQINLNQFCSATFKMSGHISINVLESKHF